MDVPFQFNYLNKMIIGVWRGNVPFATGTAKFALRRWRFSTCRGWSGEYRQAVTPSPILCSTPSHPYESHTLTHTTIDPPSLINPDSNVSGDFTVCPSLPGSLNTLTETVNASIKVHVFENEFCKCLITQHYISK